MKRNPDAYRYDYYASGLFIVVSSATASIIYEQDCGHTRKVAQGKRWENLSEVAHPYIVSFEGKSHALGCKSLVV